MTVTGDGCFLMTAMEISTAAREGLPVKFFILDDQAYHYMQVLQEQAYRRTTATILARLDYAALAKGFGVEYREIDSDTDLEGGVCGALEHPGPVLTRVVTDYGKRPIRWLDAVRSRYIDGLTTSRRCGSWRGSARGRWRSGRGTTDARRNSRENAVASLSPARKLEESGRVVAAPSTRNTIRLPPVSASLSCRTGRPRNSFTPRAARRPRRGVSFMGASTKPFSPTALCRGPWRGDRTRLIEVPS